MQSPPLSHLPDPPAGRSGWPWTPAAPGGQQGEALPRITVVTPNLNQGAFIEETIRSVLQQGYPDLEYIIVDGGSTDASLDIVRKYEPWLAHWVSEPDRSQAEAINKGMAKASGTLLAFLNSDDVLEPGALFTAARRWRAAGSPHFALLSGGVQDIDGAGRPLPGHFQPSRMGSLREWLFGGISLHQPGTLWTAPTWQEFGPLAEEFHYIFDRHFYAKLSADPRVEFLVVDTDLARFRLHETNKTVAAGDRFAAEWERAVEHLANHPPARLQAAVRRLQWERRHVEFSKQMLAESDRKAARGRMLKHVMRDPAALSLRPVAGALRRLYFR
jgi:hypothetical protein